MTTNLPSEAAGTFPVKITNIFDMILSPTLGLSQCLGLMEIITIVVILSSQISGQKQVLPTKADNF